MLSFVSHVGCQRRRTTNCVLGIALVLAAIAPAAGQGFVGQTRCANPTCHGAAQPSSLATGATGCAEKYAGSDWRPWRSARTQWLDRNVDRHSRAYATLVTDDGKRIASYMGLAPTSEKCLVCHAPPAPVASGSKHREKDGVSCEHCHGPAEVWLEPHKARDWAERKAQYAERGFYDNNDLRRRADKCASCHVEIDHEIVAAGHPPLQFEMVAYAQVMQHWDDCDEWGPDGANPTLWALGQIVGLRRALGTIAQRAAGADYQSLSDFPHFKDRNCYTCHHKLVEDATRQAQGHLDMSDVVFAILFPDAQPQLIGRWKEVVAGVDSSATVASQQAIDLRGWLAPFEAKLTGRAADGQARALLCRLAGGGGNVGSVRRFAFTRPPRGNVLRIEEPDLPWWYTTGTREQIALGIQALCPSAFSGVQCATILSELRTLVAAANRADSDPRDFAVALRTIKGKLCK